MAERWRLVYWTDAFRGRAEFIRLMFEAAGEPYAVDCDSQAIARSICLRRELGENRHSPLPYPATAPPYLYGPDGYFCANVPAIMCTLGKVLGLYPDQGEDEIRGFQLNATITDFIAEGRIVFHSHKLIGSYKDQIEETKDTIEWFEKERLHRWLIHLEESLLRAKDGGESYFLSGKLTYVDIAVFHALNAAEFQFPQEYAKVSIPKCKAFQTRIAKLPRIAEYLKSERCPKFAGDSMM